MSLRSAGGGRERWEIEVCSFGLVLLVNSAYVAAFSSATVFYMANVLAHVVLGAMLAIATFYVLRRSGWLAKRLWPSVRCYLRAFWARSSQMRVTGERMLGFCGRTSRWRRWA